LGIIHRFPEGFKKVIFSSQAALELLFTLLSDGLGKSVKFLGILQAEVKLTKINK
jgi:hypothetical protein